jgi:hypothetical protein
LVLHPVRQGLDLVLVKDPAKVVLVAMGPKSQE